MNASVVTIKIIPQNFNVWINDTQPTHSTVHYTRGVIGTDKYLQH